MKKVLAALSAALIKVKDIIVGLWRKIFPSQQENFFKKGLLLGLAVAVVILIVVLAVLYFTGVIGNRAKKASPVKISVTIVTKENCVDCWDTGLFINALSQQEIKIVSKKTAYVDGKNWPILKDGDDLVKQFNITKLPTIIIDADFKKNQELANFLAPNLGDMIDGRFVLRQIIPPYIDVASGETKGKVQITYLTDNSCKECYDVNVHGTALTNLGVPTTNVKTVDISTDEGKQLISKYSIKAVPTLLLTGEVSEYQSLVSVWSEVGTIATDGTYVFTDLSVMNGAYKDLSKNKIIQPAPAQ